ncbi:MAG: cytochrome P460 family protein [Betaproteobacteria bacterium]|nr:MAG: cytochrome P460 family protein [Betaproteobacteria bacterium]
MRAKILASSLLALVFGFGGVAAVIADGHMAPTEGKAFIRYITEKDDYTKWPLFPGKGKLYKGAHPHGALLTTYVSPDAMTAIRGKKGVIPSGGIIVKENYSPEAKLAAVTVMYKKAGYNPDAGDWYWIKYAPNGAIEKEGKVAGCINCHRAVQGNDWVFTGPVK